MGALDHQRRREAHQVAQQLSAVLEALPPGRGAMVALVEDLNTAVDLLAPLAV
jgi:hypothetical protein